MLMEGVHTRGKVYFGCNNIAETHTLWAKMQILGIPSRGITLLSHPTAAKP